MSVRCSGSNFSAASVPQIQSAEQRADINNIESVSFPRFCTSQ